MSALGQKRTNQRGPKSTDVRFGPKADIPTHRGINRDPHFINLANDRALRLFDIAAAQADKIHELIKKTEAAGGDPEREPIPPELEGAWPPPWLEVIPAGTERDEHDALCEGLCDLERLLRYEQRAWSRRKKAIRAFMAINLANLDQEEPT